MWVKQKDVQLQNFPRSTDLDKKRSAQNKLQNWSCGTLQFIVLEIEGEVDSQCPTDLREKTIPTREWHFARSYSPINSISQLYLSKIKTHHQDTEDSKHLSSWKNNGHLGGFLYFCQDLLLRIIQEPWSFLLLYYHYLFIDITQKRQTEHQILMRKDEGYKNFKSLQEDF